MKSIRTVNLLWESKTRASYPVSRYAVSDDGSVTLAMPRPLEVRAFDLTSIDTAQTKRTGSGFSVETLVKLDVSSASGVSLGMTSDDLYLISEGKKNRFLGDKHLLYVDSSLSRDGKILTAGFSDMSGTSFCIAYGDISGEAHWLHEVSEPISCIALASDGMRVVARTTTCAACKRPVFASAR